MPASPIREDAVLYEDNHIIIVNKKGGEIVQADRSLTSPLLEKVKAYLKYKHNKPGNVFLGVVHRIDQPTSGAVIFAKTSKALTRLNKMLKDKEINKTYLALTHGVSDMKKGDLTHYLWRNPKNNKTTAFIEEGENTKLARLSMEEIQHSENYSLLKINLITGRHHQIRAQLQTLGLSIKNDRKYGAKRIDSVYNGIFLHAWRLTFIHPISKEIVNVTAPIPWDINEVEKIGLGIPQ